MSAAASDVDGSGAEADGFTELPALACPAASGALIAEIPDGSVIAARSRAAPILPAVTPATLAVPVVAARRMVFIDVARSFAILAALAAHTVAVFAVWPMVPSGAFKAVANAIFSTATPTFFLLYGVMLELVYVRQRQREGVASVSRRLAGRAVKCWLGLTLGLVCAWISGRILSPQVPGALVGLIDTPNSGILRLYTAAMVICIPVVVWRPRLGPGLALTLVAVIWGLSPMLDLMSWPDPGSRWAFLTGFLFAHPPVWTAGSLWHDLSVVFLGMALGFHLRQRLDRGLRPLGGTMVLSTVAVCVIGTVICALLMGPENLAYGYLGTGRLLRSACHPAYFFISTLSALALLWVAQMLFPPTTDAGRKSEPPLLAIGRHSLVIFAVGCAGLNLVPPGWHPPFWIGVIDVVFYLSGIWVLALILDARQKALKQLPSTAKPIP